MRCSGCDAPLDVSNVFPGGAVTCACGAVTTLPAATRDTDVPSPNAPYREGQRPVEAAMMTCPFCGGPCASDVRACPHCDVELASVRCPHCFALHFSGARFCARCGKELELEPLLDASDAPCPRCSRPLGASSTTGTNECASCGGIFVDHNAFAAIAAEHEAHARLAPVVHEARASSAGEVVRYVRCPVCSELMNRQNYGKRSGVIVDVCRMHGTWFDVGELTRVVEFVASGGLEETRRRDRELHQESHAKAATAAAELQIALAQEHYREQRRLGRELETSDTLGSLLYEFVRWFVER